MPKPPATGVKTSGDSRKPTALPQHRGMWDGRDRPCTGAKPSDGSVRAVSGVKNQMGFSVMFFVNSQGAGLCQLQLVRNSFEASEFG